jgi:uncharacterized protein (TIGR04255 family)
MLNAIQAFPQLDHPPINEVVCGFVFESTSLTALDFGAYRDERLEDFPKAELHPPIVETAGFRFGNAVEARVWLVGKSDELVLQLQADRFYMNWRRREGRYPRFSDHDGEEGLKTLAIREFERFAEFCGKRTSSPLNLLRLELTKIDLIQRAEGQDLARLRDILPITSVFDQIAISHPTNLNLRMAEATDECQTTIALGLDQQQVNLEVRHLFPFTGNLEHDFAKANGRVNQVFFGLAKPEHFGIKGEK